MTWTGITVDYSATNVTIDGNTANSNGDNGIRLHNSTGCTVANNIAEYNKGSWCANIILRASSNNNIVTGNTANYHEQDYGIMLAPLLDNTGNVIPGTGCNNNTIDGNNANFNKGYGIYVHTSANNTIKNNDASSNGMYGIYLYNYADNNTLTGNTANSNGQPGETSDRVGILISKYSSSNTITDSTISSNSAYGIVVENNSTNNEIHYNNIYDNAVYGLYSDNSSPTNATCNWWGDASGPYHSTNPSGTGDAVSANVVYNPWVGLPSSLVYTATLPQPATSVTLEATVSDCTSTGISGVEVYFYLDDSVVGSAITGSDGVATFTVLREAGVYEAYAEVNGLKSETEYLVVYDPSAGFVTGGGWIDSPAGAYTTNPTLIGKATFGFVSKYQKGANVPTGQTEFQFKVANFNFKSTSYDWLVIAGAKAMYKGTGTINGAGNYGFMLSAIDEKLTPSTDVDMFRIKIWDKGTGTVIYDNQIGDDDNAELTTGIGDGQIVIHKGK